MSWYHYCHRCVRMGHSLSDCPERRHDPKMSDDAEMRDLIRLVQRENNLHRVLWIIVFAAALVWWLLG